MTKKRISYLILIGAAIYVLHLFAMVNNINERNYQHMIRNRKEYVLWKK